ncbi:Diacylglycerol kinase [Bertholletia excelsa]
MDPLRRPPQTPAFTQRLQHFTHPSHPLQKLQIASVYVCNGCNTLGFGERYHCAACDFDLHERCATCPASLPPSHLHRVHSLTLVYRPVAGGGICDICLDPVNGLFYTCPACNFDVHPLCTQLPPQVHHQFDPWHPLTLQEAMPGRCNICHQECPSWRYRCGACHVDVHIECITAPPQRPPPATWVPPGSLGFGGYPAAFEQNGYPNQVQDGRGVPGHNSMKRIFWVLAQLGAHVLMGSLIEDLIG